MTLFLHVASSLKATWSHQLRLSQLVWCSVCQIEMEWKPRPLVSARVLERLHFFFSFLTERATEGTVGFLWKFHWITKNKFGWPLTERQLLSQVNKTLFTCFQSLCVKKQWSRWTGGIQNCCRSRMNSAVTSLLISKLILNLLHIHNTQSYDRKI